MTLPSFLRKCRMFMGTMPLKIELFEFMRRKVMRNVAAMEKIPAEEITDDEEKAVKAAYSKYERVIDFLIQAELR